MSTLDYGILAPAWAATGAADLVDDNALLTAMLDTEVALAEAQAELGVIPAGAAVAIRAAAVPAHIDLDVVAAGVRETANPVVAFVEQLTAAVRSVDASAAEYVHRGSTSQDILDTALTLLCAATLDRIADDLLACADSLAGHAARQVLPGCRHSPAGRLQCGPASLRTAGSAPCPGCPGWCYCGARTRRRTRRPTEPRRSVARRTPRRGWPSRALPQPRRQGRCEQARRRP